MMVFGVFQSHLLYVTHTLLMCLNRLTNTHLQFVYIDINLNYMASSKCRHFSSYIHVVFFSFKTVGIDFRAEKFFLSVFEKCYFFQFDFDNSLLIPRMKRWRFNTLLLIAIFSCCLVTISAIDDDDDDGVTIESEKIVNTSNKRLLCFLKTFHSPKEM